MRPIKLIVSALTLLCASALWGAPPASVQQCNKANGGVSTQFYTVTIGSVGGTTGCTANFTGGDMIIVAYNQVSGSTNRTTANISAIGATITWRKAGTTQNSVFGPPGYFTGVLYACPSDITSPTSAIAITVDMGASMASITSIFAQEVSNIVSSSCFDSAGFPGNPTTSVSSCCNGATFAAGSGTTPNNPVEFIFATAMAYDGTAIVLSADGCHGFTATIPPQGQIQDNTGNNSAEAIEYAATTSAVFGTCRMGNTGSPNSVTQNMVEVGFIGSPPGSGRGPKGKIL